METKISKSILFLSIFIFSIASFYLHSTALCLAILAFGLFFAWRNKVISGRFILVLTAVFVVGIFYTYWRTPVGDALQKYTHKEAQISGTVRTSPKFNNHKIKFYFDVEKIGKNSDDLGSTAVSIFSEKPAEFQIGDRLVLEGKFAIPYGAKNYGQFDYANYLKNQGIFTVFYAKKYHLEGQNPDWFFRMQAFFDGLTQKIMAKQSKYLSQNQADLLGGIVFGHKSVELDDNIQQNFINSGVFHVLAASGMQIGLVLFFWYFITRFLGLPYLWSMISGAVLIVIYAAFTGFPASIVRALLMAEFIIFGKLIDRQADNIALLLLVCSIMLLHNPLSLMDVGFQLSFVTTFGLLFCMPKFVEKVKLLPEFVSGTLIMTVVAQIFASPLLVFYFNNLSLYSLFANILIIPFVSIITFVGFFSSFVALVPHSDIFIRVVTFCLAPLLDGMNFVAEFFANLPSALLYIKQISVFSVALAYLFVLFGVWAADSGFKNKWFNSASIFGLVLFLTLNINFMPQKNLEIVFFDVGNSDAILLKLPNGKQFLVDTGRANPYGSSSGKTVIAEYMKATGHAQIEAIVLTHQDSDHIGGCCDVLDFAPAKNIYQSCIKGDSYVNKDLQSYLLAHEIPVARIPAGKCVDLKLDNSVKIKLIAPYGCDKNNSSLVTYVEYGDFRALLLGDNEKEVLKILKDKIKGPITLLKVGHHGSRDALDERMIEVLSIKNAVISVGKNNFGHPDDEVLDILESNNVKTYRTDRDNMLLFSSDGSGFAAKRYFSWTKKIE